MTFDLDLATAFMTSHARLLDRRRFALLAKDPTTDQRRAVVAAVEAYVNPDGGVGCGMEPDLRAPESQPAGAQHALEAIGEAAAITPVTIMIFDWLDSVTRPDGGLPFALPINDPTACAPFWVDADHDQSSLQISAVIAAQAHRIARYDEQARRHPWLDRVTRYCLTEIGKIDDEPFAYVLSFVLQFLDELAETDARAGELLRSLGRFVPADGAVAVTGGSAGETLHLLHFASRPDRPVRALVDHDAVEADLDRLAAGQQDDGGWTVDFHSYSEAAALEWRGYATVNAVATLLANGRASV